jgi:hypothetical protein
MTLHCIIIWWMMGRSNTERKEGSRLGYPDERLHILQSEALGRDNSTLILRENKHCKPAQGIDVKL